METKKQRVQSGFCAAGTWIADAMGRGMPHPFQTSLDDITRYYQDKERLLYERCGDVGFGNPDPPAEVGVPQHDGRVICATAYGASYPQWDPLSGSFWLDDARHVWEGITVKDLERLPIPDWGKNPLVQENIQKWNEVQEKVGKAQSQKLYLGWTDLEWTHPNTTQYYRFCTFPSFLDLGSFLMGSCEFLTTLAADPELAEALLRKCFEISASQADFMCRLYGRPRIGWSSLGGDNSCLVSADMYRRYAMRFDQWVRDLCGNIPRNLHSCGASQHLYDAFGEYPELDRIVLMQTRAIPGQMKPLRKALPHTYIQITIHQPQIDFERETPDRVRELVWQFAEDLEFRDMSITVIFSAIDDRCKANILAFQKAVSEVNAMETVKGKSS